MDGKIGSISVVACFQHFVGWVGIRVSVEYSSAMKGSAILMAFLVVVLVYCHPVQAQCPPILTRAQGAVSGELQDGDMLFLKFIYSRKRVESSSPQQPQGRTFTVTGAYSTFTRMKPAGLGTEDCRDQFNHLEERSGIRRPTIASTSSLSISEEQAFPSLRFTRSRRSFFLDIPFYRTQ